jgi:hypothetical protein
MTTYHARGFLVAYNIDATGLDVFVLILNDS